MLAGLVPSNRRKKHLVGVSGGRDSMALLHCLVAAGCTRLVVCHLDHGLRGAASTRDATFVRKEAARLQLPFETAKADTATFARQHGLSLELAARELRHAFFEICARKHRCRNLLLAHHADDQIETIFFHFLRGSGAAGLTGIKSPSTLGKTEVRRPLLAVPRDQITEYIRTNKIAYREDASNASFAHTRNRIRHLLLPAVEKTVGVAYRAAILRTARILADENVLLDSLTPEPGTELSCPELRALPPALQRRMILRWMKTQGIAEAGFAEVERVLTLLDSGNGPAKINLPGARHARRRQGKIFLE